MAPARYVDYCSNPLRHSVITYAPDADAKWSNNNHVHDFKNHIKIPTRSSHACFWLSQTNLLQQPMYEYGKNGAKYTAKNNMPLYSNHHECNLLTSLVCSMASRCESRYTFIFYSEWSSIFHWTAEMKLKDMSLCDFPGSIILIDTGFGIVKLILKIGAP